MASLVFSVFPVHIALGLRKTLVVDIVLEVDIVEMAGNNPEVDIVQVDDTVLLDNMIHRVEIVIVAEAGELSVHHWQC